MTLHSYRYAWAERVKICGYPERIAQEALGHNSKVVHRAYAERVLMKNPSLEDFELITVIHACDVKLRTYLLIAPEIWVNNRYDKRSQF